MLRSARDALHAGPHAHGLPHMCVQAVCVCNERRDTPDSCLKRPERKPVPAAPQPLQTDGSVHTQYVCTRRRMVATLGALFCGIPITNGRLKFVRAEAPSARHTPLLSTSAWNYTIYDISYQLQVFPVHITGLGVGVRATPL